MANINLGAFNDSVKQCLLDNQNAINKERLEPIHPQTICYKNSVNILVGKQGSGKTFTCVYEIAKITQLHPETHLLVVFCKDENKEDPTVKALNTMINVPIEYVTEENAESYVQRLLECKRMYDQIIAGEDIEYDTDNLQNTLKINDFYRY